MIGPFWHKKGVKHIITCHDLMHLVVPGFFRVTPIKAALRKLRIKYFFKYVAKMQTRLYPFQKQHMTT